MVNKIMTKLSENELDSISGGKVGDFFKGLGIGLGESMTGGVAICIHWMRSELGVYWPVALPATLPAAFGSAVGVAAFIRIGYAWAKHKYKKKCKSKK